MAFSAPGINDVAPSVKATVDGTKLTIELSAPPSSSNQGARTTAVLDLAAVALSSLPKAVVTVIAPPSDKPPLYGRALVDLRDPLATPNLPLAIADLTIARDTAVKDAQSRLKLDNTEFAGIDALGVMHWPDDALGCQGVTPSNRVVTRGYVLFVVQAGVPVSRELEYHSGGGRTVFCGFSR